MGPSQNAVRITVEPLLRRPDIRDLNSPRYRMGGLLRMHRRHEARENAQPQHGLEGAEPARATWRDFTPAPPGDRRSADATIFQIALLAKDVARFTRPSTRGRGSGSAPLPRRRTGNLIADREVRSSAPPSGSGVRARREPNLATASSSRCCAAASILQCARTIRESSARSPTPGPPTAESGHAGARARRSRGGGWPRTARRARPPRAPRNAGLGPRPAGRCGRAAARRSGTRSAGSASAYTCTAPSGRPTARTGTG